MADLFDGGGHQDVPRHESHTDHDGGDSDRQADALGQLNRHARVSRRLARDISTRTLYQKPKHHGRNRLPLAVKRFALGHDSHFRYHRDDIGALRCQRSSAQTSSDRLESSIMASWFEAQGQADLSRIMLFLQIKPV